MFDLDSRARQDLAFGFADQRGLRGRRCLLVHEDATRQAVELSCLFNESFDLEPHERWHEPL
jgi:hypothetical protein